jgi:hypothetical protein
MFTAVGCGAKEKTETVSQRDCPSHPFLTKTPRVESAMGLPHCKTLRQFERSRKSRQRRGVRQPYAAFAYAIARNARSGKTISDSRSF